MGMNCAPLTVDLFLNSPEEDSSHYQASGPLTSTNLNSDAKLEFFTPAEIFLTTQKYN
jgi:hypothetical protein